MLYRKFAFRDVPQVLLQALVQHLQALSVYKGLVAFSLRNKGAGRLQNDKSSEEVSSWSTALLLQRVWRGGHLRTQPAAKQL